MCGIAGVWGDTKPEIIQDLMAAQRHRGPDGEGIQMFEHHGGLGHVRLSIMDPERGTQPVRNESGEVTLVANGMIYNHPRLRSGLRDLHSFSSTSDSETVLHVFEEWREKTPGQLDGAFAFAVADGEDLFLARDPIGIKPLYFGYDHRVGDGTGMVFSSELKAISRWVDDVREFPAGTCFSSRTGFQTYYQVPRLKPVPAPVDTYVQQVRETLEEAVEKRLLSDVPLGAFLSGGLDSSIIAAMARRVMGELHTFSVGIEGSRDLAAARRVARHIDSIHHEYAFTVEEIREALPEIVYYLESFDQDLVRSAIPCHFCSRLAANHVKVILTGEGADELFAGYEYYRSIKHDKQLHEAMRLSVEGLHNVNLQRVDRMTMRHGIEGRVPFLDTAMIELAQRIPPELKLNEDRGSRPVEKWILRRAVEDLLPHDIVWREKEQFDEGSGTVDILGQMMAGLTAGMDWQSYREQYPEDRLRSPEECYYHRLLVGECENPAAVLRNVGRWTGGGV